MASHIDVYHVEGGKKGNIATADGRAWHGYRCGHCGDSVTGCVVALTDLNTPDPVRWLLCPGCGGPSVSLDDGSVVPNSKPGPDISGLPEAVARGYEEARRALGAGCYTACELVCRKVLMYIADDLTQAGEGKTFVQYVTALEKAGYVTPPMKPWVDQIRQHGNEATHELPEIDRGRASGTLAFTAELLRLSYEMEHLRNQFAPGT